MNRPNIQLAILALMIILFSTSGCGGFNALPFIATKTPYPTYTPYPTVTPYPTITDYPTYTPYPTFTEVPTYTPAPPTATPIPALWNVKVISVEKSLNFGNLIFTKAQNSEFLIITIEYTNMGQNRTDFSPMSVLLLFPDGSSYPGGAYTVYDYQSESSNKVTNFITEEPIINYLNPGETRREKFAWVMWTGNVDKKFLLLFPETKPIDVIVPNQ